tara:strand:+ start:108 stop:395 length:288 start_codon:yes stop_codon:yes gene_type:complete
MGLKSVNTSPSNPSYIRQELFELENQIARLTAERNLKRLLIEALSKHENNPEYYSQWGDGFLTTSQFIETLQGVSDDLRYQIALAVLESNEMVGK